MTDTIVRPPATLKKTFLAATGTALVIRLCFLFFWTGTHLNSDSGEYLAIAGNLAASGAYSIDGTTPDHTRAPLYPFLIAAVKKLSPAPGLRAILTAQCLLDSLSAGLVCLLAAAFFGRRTALLAGLAYAAHPVFTGFTGLILSETLFMFFWLSFMCLLAYALEGAKPRLFAAAGAALGLAVLTRAALLYYPAALLPIIYFSRGPFKNRALCLVLALAAFAAALAPWTIRNEVQFRRFLPVCTGGALATWFGSVPEFNDNAGLYSIWPGGDVKSFEAEAAILKVAKENWRTNAPAIIKFLPKKLAKFWITSHSSVFDVVKPNSYYLKNGLVSVFIFKAALLALQTAILIGGLWGLWALRADWRRLLMLLMPALYVSAHIFNDSGPARYHIAALPPLIILGLGAFEKILSEKKAAASSGKAG